MIAQIGVGVLLSLVVVLMAIEGVVRRLLATVDAAVAIRALLLIVDGLAGCDCGG